MGLKLKKLRNPWSLNITDFPCAKVTPSSVAEITYPCSTSPELWKYCWGMLLTFQRRKKRKKMTLTVAYMCEMIFDMREHLWYICCGILTCEQMDIMYPKQTFFKLKTSCIIIQIECGSYVYIPYLQCLHLTPNIMLLWHTWHIWDSQDLVENLQRAAK